MNWDNVRIDKMPSDINDHLLIQQFHGGVGKFILELNVLTGDAKLKELSTNETALSGPMDHLIEIAIAKYSAHPFGSFAFFLRKCRARAIYELYTSPEYNKALRNFRFP